MFCILVFPLHTRMGVAWIEGSWGMRTCLYGSLSQAQKIATALNSVILLLKPCKDQTSDQGPCCHWRQYLIMNYLKVDSTTNTLKSINLTALLQVKKCQDLLGTSAAIHLLNFHLRKSTYWAINYVSHKELSELLVLHLLFFYHSFWVTPGALKSHRLLCLMRGAHPLVKLSNQASK